MRTLVCVLLLSAVLVRESSAHPYLPLEEGTQGTSDYHFRVETDRKEFLQANTDGLVRTESKQWVEKDGKRLLQYRTSYEGIPFMKDSVSFARREDERGVFYIPAPPGKEMLELPRDVSVGTEWSYNDGAESQRRISARVSIELPGGEKLTDCLEVTRTVLKNPVLKHLQDTSIYCRDRGVVRTLTVQPTPVGNYRTETLQRSFQKR